MRDESNTRTIHVIDLDKTASPHEIIKYISLNRYAVISHTTLHNGDIILLAYTDKDGFIQATSGFITDLTEKDNTIDILFYERITDTKVNYADHWVSIFSLDTDHTKMTLDECGVLTKYLMAFSRHNNPVY